MLGYATFISVAFFLMPENPDEITAPMELVEGFRGASFVAVSVYWLTLRINSWVDLLKNFKNG